MNSSIQKLKLFFVIIMLNIKKVFSLTLILVTLSFMFLCNAISHTYVVSKDCLRVPIGNYGRLNKVLNEELPFEGKNILIVQDYPEIAELRELFCVGQGAEEKDIVIASDYEAAINALSTKNFDLIILDMGFYIKDGDFNWAGISVLEYIVSNNKIAFVLVDSSKVERNLNAIYRKIEENSGKYPNLARLGKAKIDMFAKVFLKNLEPDEIGLKSFLQRCDLDGLRKFL